MVFCNRNGAHFHVNSLDRDFAKLLKSVGLPKMRFHDLRHSAVTILLRMGVPPHVVQEIAGHSDVRITLGVYGYVLPSQQEEAMSKWDDKLGSSDKEQRADLQLQWSSYSAAAQAWLEILMDRYGKDAAQLALNAIKNL